MTRTIFQWYFDHPTTARVTYNSALSIITIESTHSIIDTLNTLIRATTTNKKARKQAAFKEAVPLIDKKKTAISLSLYRCIVRRTAVPVYLYRVPCCSSSSSSSSGSNEGVECVYY